MLSMDRTPLSTRLLNGQETNCLFDSRRTTSMEGSARRTYLAAVAPPPPPPGPLAFHTRACGRHPPPPRHQPRALGAPRRRPELHEPPRAVRILVHEARILPDRLVDLHDLPAPRRRHGP